jgi:hypothetical protein
VVTDREALLALLDRFGLQPAPSTEAGRVVSEQTVTATDVVLLAKHGNVDGYTDFHAVFHFNDAGDFASLGIWE